MKSSKPTYYAHSGVTTEKFEDWHLLSDHLIRTGEIAADFAGPFGAAKAARLAGLLHDLGKYSGAFQARLKGSKTRVDHSTAGADYIWRQIMAKDNDLLSDEKYIGDLVAYAIAGHHAGLADKLAPNGTCLKKRLDRHAIENPMIDPCWKDEISPDMTGTYPDLKMAKTKVEKLFQFGFLGRMIFSCLVDADYKDTEAFYAALERKKVDRDWPCLIENYDALISKFEARIAGFGRPISELNRLRADILKDVRGRASEKPGFFTLTVPTGGGKTLASLGFALDHAKAHQRRRIIYAIPYTSIIDQTARQFKDIMGEEYVLEHHSAVEEDCVKKRQQYDKLKLAMEDWAAPVVVTTTVQLYESLFAARTSRCRKLHNIADSVIILDEAQVMPRGLLIPILCALRELERNYGCTIVLCTATQPALDENNFQKGDLLGLPLEGRELVPNPTELAKSFRRVTIIDGGILSDENIMQALAQEQSGLVIVNSRKHALELYNSTKSLEGVFHLTTRHHAADRRHILSVIRKRLDEGAPCRVIATSLIEAGVDIDFARVWRAEAGLDQIAQAAGRCNREQKRSIEESIVTVFRPADHKTPHSIKVWADKAQLIFEKYESDILSPEAMRAYFAEVYWHLNIGDDGGNQADVKDIMSLFAGCSPKDGLDISYRTIAERFRMIESAMVPVIVPTDEKSAGLVENLNIEAVPSGKLARQLQQYIVQIPERDRTRLLAEGAVLFVAPELRGDQFAVLQSISLYKEETGLVWEGESDGGWVV